MFNSSTKTPWISLLILGLSALPILVAFATAQEPNAQEPKKDAAGFTLEKAKPFPCADFAQRNMVYRGLLFADVTGDGKIDLITTEVSGLKVTLYAGTDSKDWPFAAGTPLKLADGTNATFKNWCCTGPSPQWVDLDNDGHKDLVVGSFGGQTLWLRGTEKGFLKAEVLKDVSGKDVTLTAFYDYSKKEYSAHKVQPFPPADLSPKTSEDRSEACRLVDWNQDGKPDLLLLGTDGGFYIRLQEKAAKSPVFAELNQVLRDHKGDPMDMNRTHAIVSLHDWDGDGLTDIVCVQGDSFDGSNDLCWYRNVGTSKKPSYDPLQALAKDIGKQITGIEFFDVDHDGVKDLVTGNYAGELYWSKRMKSASKP